RYLNQMGCAANFAFANRALIQLTVEKILKKYGINSEIIYDVGHNLLTIENRNNMTVAVHRKGASKALTMGHPDLKGYYEKIGQPIPIGGSMGTASYLLLAKETEKSNYSCPHGSGRVLSRNEAKRRFSNDDVKNSMTNILLFCKSENGAIEEHPEVYKDIDLVADAACELNLTEKIVRLVPIGVIKG
ncbi:hypothetical protein M153_39450003, partial [Pseudoloma neurophilia]